MISRLIAILVVAAAFSPAARADDAQDIERLAAAIAQEAAVRAHALARAPAAPAFAPPAGDALLADLNEFALHALALSRDIEERGGPQDLRCIFRGMGRDVAARIEALETAPDRAAQSRAYREIEYLARQARDIAADPEARSVDTSYRVCSADAPSPSDAD
ncbi:MAG: hypothetical protein NXI12_12220 [Alphaproteobacteria bacterium]|nr:hypothetical protein [Alphaproteobacteria bacterium]